MNPEPKTDPVLAHVLFMDIVGCSKLPTDEQRRIVGRLQELVRESAEYRKARETDQLISLPTGDGMALAFFNKLDAAVLCAIEVTQSIQSESLCKIRMGVNTGPVFVVEDINHKRNISGTGINRAERVMSCGEEGHILLSESVAESLRHLSAWAPKIRNIGECKVKDGWVRVWNLVDGPVGNAGLPKKSRKLLKRRRMLITAAEVVVALGLIATIAGAFWAGRAGKGSGSGQDKASVAVLPFENLSVAKDQEYFSDGLSEELLNGLAKIPGLRVAGRTSSFQFKGKTESCQIIGKRLNVATLLEGSVRRQGNRARIAAQLIKASDGFSLWSETFDREMNDIFAVQEEISRAVSGALKVTLLGDKPSGKQARGTNAEAYNAYLQGRYFFGMRNKESLGKAAGYFENSIQLDPAYARAWVGLGQTHSSQAGLGFSPSEDGYRDARTAVEQALKLDPNLGEAHAALGYIKLNHDWDWAGADESYQRALVLDPGNAGVIRTAASLARTMGRWDEALKLHRRANEIDPLNPVEYHNLGILLYYAGREDEALQNLQKALELSPEMADSHCALSQVYLAKSQLRDALDEAGKEKAPAYRLFGLALAYHALNRKADSDASLAQLIQEFQSSFIFQIAEVYAFRGETDRAFVWLEKAYAERDSGLSEIKGDPLLKSIVGDPRYAAFLKKLKLPV